MADALEQPPSRAGAGVPPAAATASAGRWLDRTAWGVTVLVLLDLGLGGRVPPVALFQQLAHLVLLACLPLALLAARRGRWRAAWMLAACAACWPVYFAGRLALLAREQRPIEAADLRVLTFNLGSHRTEAAEVVALLRARGADLVALQEVGAHHVAAFERELADLYPHRALHGLGIPGMGLLSRWPLVEEELLFLTSSTRPQQRAVVLVAGRRVRVFNVHPSAWVALLGRYATGGRDLARIAELAAGSGPTLLLGDFNVTDRSDEHRLLAGVPLVDSFLESGAGLGFTFPEFLRYRGVPSPPLVRLDYVWHSPDLAAIGARVLPGGLGSDHLPLEVGLVWDAWKRTPPLGGGDRGR